MKLSYFPMLFSMKNKKILLVGAGKISFRKLEKILDFSSNITIIAKDFSEDILKKAKKHDLKVEEKEYLEGYIKDFDIVIVTVNNISLQKSIYEECKKENILCNCVDLLECCDFIFPSYIKDGDLTIAISTNGTSPSFTKKLKEYLQVKIPNDVSSFLIEMKVLRKELPKGKERMKLFDKKVKEYFKSWN